MSTIVYTVFNMSDSVQQVKEKLSILDVVSPYVELHKAGKNFKGKSPFAAEKTPSFYVSPDRGMYYCFSTSQGGDIFNFIQSMEGVDFKEALKMLAQKAGVELVAEDPRKKSERERLYMTIESATAFFQESLKNEPEAIEYLSNRGVSDETIAEWRIGFAPGPPKYGWRESKDKLEKDGYKKEELLKAGLIKNTEGGKEPFDVFRDRIVFPMAEPSGKMVAFSGRILHSNDKAPKYVNSPETELYKKSDILYGYDKAKTGIRNLDFSLIVEGQFDVVMCHQAGYENTVAVSGTALTPNHIQLLERMSEKIVLALDADRAGINAMKKGSNLMLRRGLDVKVAELPLGKDPADMIKDNPAEFKKLIGKSVHVIEFLLHVLKSEIKDERALKLKVREEVLPFVLLLPNRIDQEHFVTVIADSINSTTEAIRFELDRLREVENTTNNNEEYSDSAREERIQAEINLDSVTKAHLFLEAASLVIEEKYKKTLQTELEKVLLIVELKKPSEEKLAGTVFKLEQQFSNLPDLAIREEVINKLNYLKKILIRSKLSEQKKVLIELDGNHDEVRFSEALQNIAKYEKILREPNYTVEILS